MNARYGTKTCRTCGATFARSQFDRTVNCQSCRQSARDRAEAARYTEREWRQATGHAATGATSCSCGKSSWAAGTGAVECPRCGDRRPDNAPRA